MPLLMMKKSEKFTACISLVALTVSLITLYFSFFYVAREGKLAVLDYRVTHSFEHQLGLVLVNSGNQEVLVKELTMFAYDTRVAITHFIPPSAAVYNPTPPIILSPGKLLFVKVVGQTDSHFPDLATKVKGSDIGAKKEERFYLNFDSSGPGASMEGEFSHVSMGIKIEYIDSSGAAHERRVAIGSFYYSDTGLVLTMPFHKIHRF